MPGQGSAGKRRKEFATSMHVAYTVPARLCVTRLLYVPDKGTFPMQNYQRTLLSNGIRLLTASLPHVRSISIAYYFGVGSRYEQGEISGVSHFIEHMLFK